jgi:hypothetical protein
MDPDPEALVTADTGTVISRDTARAGMAKCVVNMYGRSGSVTYMAVSNHNLRPYHTRFSALDLSHVRVFRHH